MSQSAWQLVSQSLGAVPIISVELPGHPALRVERYFFQARRQQLPALPTLTMAVHLGGAKISGGKLSGQVSNFIPSFSVLLPPGCASEWFFDGAVDAAVFYFTDTTATKGTKINSVLKRMNDAMTAVPFTDGLVSAAAMQMVNELGRGPQADSGFVRKLGSIVVDQIERVLTGHAGRHISPDRLQLGRLNRVLDWIGKNLKQEISNASLAQQAGLSESHFRQVFVQALGVSPIRYVQQQRIEYARSLLATTNLPIAYVAAECGFVSQSYLTTCFRTTYGMTPARFRRMTG